MEEKYHRNWLANDLPRMHHQLQQASAPLQHGRLAAQGYYACKWFSSPRVRGVQGAKPDMRLIYKYNEDRTYIYLKAVGFRHDPPPIYHESERRNDTFD